ncbi:MAG TPA: Gfo/Idh/MocA family oxidoreductase [Negativicutes bacterium]|nr:Gfo/Idh/MocA family oxidoreductase [Negativicutes bacterium]
MQDRVNAAIIGFGMAGRVFHAPIINSIQDLNLSKIYTANPDSANMISTTYPDTITVSDVNEIFNDEAIQLVIIAAPNTSHYTLARDAILSGKHVIVDKPFTVTTKEADELIKLAEEHNIILSVYHNRRWESDFRTAKKVADSGLLGPLVECEIHMDRFRSYLKEKAWREDDLPGSGLLYDLGSHLIDQAVCFFGLPNAVTADLRKQRKAARAVDNFEVVLHYDRLKVTLKAGMLVNAALPRTILLGERGSYVDYGTDIQEEDLKNGFTPLNKKNWGEEPEELYGSICTNISGLDINGKVKSEKGDYRELYKNVCRAIAGEEELAVTPLQARNTIRIIECAIESSEKRCTLALHGLLNV